jgi:hypothetical protein
MDPKCPSAGDDWDRLPLQDYVPGGPHRAAAALVRWQLRDLPQNVVTQTLTCVFWPQGHSRARAFPQLDSQLHPRLVRCRGRL